MKEENKMKADIILDFFAYADALKEYKQTTSFVETKFQNIRKVLGNVIETTTPPYGDYLTAIEKFVEECKKANVKKMVLRPERLDEIFSQLKKISPLVSKLRFDLNGLTRNPEALIILTNNTAVELERV